MKIRCPNCNLECEKNERGEEVCPNCGILEELDKEDKNKPRSYVQ